VLFQVRVLPCQRGQRFSSRRYLQLNAFLLARIGAQWSCNCWYSIFSLRNHYDHSTGSIGS
jgi:hypothetical protein